MKVLHLLSRGLMATSLVIASVALASPQAVADHDDTPYYNTRWDHVGDETRAPTWGFADGVPTTSGWRSRIQDAANAWNNLPQTYMQFVYEPGDWAQSEWYVTCADYAVFYQADIVSQGSIGSGYDGALAFTKACYTGRGTMSNFRIRYNTDSGYSWYTGTNQTVPTGSYDLWSVMAQEFGHATGRFGGEFNGHYDEYDRNDMADVGAACTSQMGLRSTMCPTVPVATSGMRYLEPHDASSFDDVPYYN